MEGRFPDAIRMIRTSCTDPVQEAGFNHWYNQVHTPDVLSSGTVSHVIRYRNSDSGDAGPGYLAIHELTTRDFEAVAGEVMRMRRRLVTGGGFHPALEIIRAESWEKVGREFASPNAATPVAGIFVIGSRCTAPRREQEFNAWHDDVHIPDLLDTGLFVSAYRFAAVAAGSIVGHEVPRDGVPAVDAAGTTAYLAIYETVADPPEAVREFSRAHQPRLQAAGRISDLMDVTWRGVYLQLVSHAAAGSASS